MSEWTKQCVVCGKTCDDGGEDSYDSPLTVDSVCCDSGVCMGEDGAVLHKDPRCVACCDSHGASTIRARLGVPEPGSPSEDPGRTVERIVRAVPVKDLDRFDHMVEVAARILEQLVEEFGPNELLDEATDLLTEAGVYHRLEKEKKEEDA